jgi:hypothetical protein
MTTSKNLKGAQKLHHLPMLLLFSMGIVRSRTKATEFSLVYVMQYEELWQKGRLPTAECGGYEDIDVGGVSCGSREAAYLGP